VLRTVPSGWRNNPSGLQEVRYRVGGREVTVGYRRRRDGAFACMLDGVPARARILAAAPPSIELEIDGLRGAFRVTTGPGGIVFAQDAHGELRLRELPRFPELETDEVAGGYSAPMPGRVLDIRVSTGDAVAKGQLLLTMEAMKMELHVTASTDGVVTEVRASPGQQVNAGQVLVVIDARAESPR
jgi:propionyl-CoA carboxylase alpha chain